MKNRICSLLLIIILFVIACFVFIGSSGEPQQDPSANAAP